MEDAKMGKIRISSTWEVSIFFVTFLWIETFFSKIKVDLKDLINLIKKVQYIHPSPST